MIPQATDLYVLMARRTGTDTMTYDPAWKVIGWTEDLRPIAVQLDTEAMGSAEAMELAPGSALVVKFVDSLNIAAKLAGARAPLFEGWNDRD